MTRITKLILIRHYGAWVKQHLEGWDGYFFRVLFQQLPGSLMINSQLMEKNI
jgi:hypothetical protein